MSRTYHKNLKHRLVNLLPDVEDIGWCDIGGRYEHGVTSVSFKVHIKKGSRSWFSLWNRRECDGGNNLWYLPQGTLTQPHKMGVGCQIEKFHKALGAKLS